jgi:UDP-N-acetylmuramate: L-alanyl-gamma-D-glutamyl-meso-diaminopimelate ligase
MRIHFIAIGGAAMHQLAIALHLNGNIISGSDDEIFDPALSNLRKYNLIKDNYLWDTESITKEIDLIILGMHARNDNPELKRAIELGIEVVSFPEYVYKASINKKRVVIGGSHGKTSITSMIMHVLKENGFSFDYLVGSRVRGFDVMVSIKDENDLIIIEGDEYLSSCLDLRPKFHHYHPDIAVVSGIEWDHINVFPQFDLYIEAFKTFINNVPDNGSIIWSKDDKNLFDLMSKYSGKAENVPYVAINNLLEDNQVKLILNDKLYPVNIFGNHNMMNISAAFEVCKRLGVSDAQFFEAISSFEGAARRLEMIYEKNGIRFFRDFAHAPSKLKATVNAVKTRFPDEQLVSIFELHTFSSMNINFLPHYSGALDLSDIAAVYFSPNAFHHKKLKPFSHDDIIKGFNRQNLYIINNPTDLKEFVLSKIKVPTNVLFMSSGNFDNANLEEISLLCEQKNITL